jgi:hypothetical protein
MRSTACCPLPAARYLVLSARCSCDLWRVSMSRQNRACDARVGFLTISCRSRRCRSVTAPAQRLYIDYLAHDREELENESGWGDPLPRPTSLPLTVVVLVQGGVDAEMRMTDVGSITAGERGREPRRAAPHFASTYLPHRRFPRYLLRGATTSTGGGWSGQVRSGQARASQC